MKEPGYLESAVVSFTSSRLMFEVDISLPINKVSDCVNIASATCYEQ